MRFACAVALCAAVLSTSASAQQRAAQREWRPDWAAEVPYVPPAGTIGISAFTRARSPCEIQLYIANATDTSIRDIWGTIVVQPGVIPISFHARFIDPNFVRGVPVITSETCPRNIERIELREVTPCYRGRAIARGCDAPFVPYLGRLTERRSDAVPVSVAPDFDR